MIVPRAFPSANRSAYTPSRSSSTFSRTISLLRMRIEPTEQECVGACKHATSHRWWQHATERPAQDSGTAVQTVSRCLVERHNFHSIGPVIIAMAEHNATTGSHPHAPKIVHSFHPSPPEPTSQVSAPLDPASSSLHPSSYPSSHTPDKQN